MHWCKASGVCRGEDDLGNTELAIVSGCWAWFKPGSLMASYGFKSVPDLWRIPPFKSAEVTDLTVDESERSFPLINVRPVDVQVALPRADLFQVSAVLESPCHHLEDDEILNRQYRDL